jgi:hypothetical protein
MIMKRFFTFWFILCAFGLNGQTIDDILRVSYQDYEGTARFASMGGAFGALGGDISSISINPAGLAVFRKPYVSLTTSLNHIYNNADVAGIRTGDSRVRPGISSFGIALVLEDQTPLKWNVGIAYMKKTNFNRRTSVKNVLNANSIIDCFTDKANGDMDFFSPDGLLSPDAFYDYNPLNWDVVMAYGTHLFDLDENGYYSSVLHPDDHVYQEINSLSKGSSGELVFDLGMSFNDKIYAGLLLGMTTLNYRREMIYSEYAYENNTSDFDRLRYNTNMKFSGFGLNCKLGIIYKPVHALRFGLAFHSPDYLRYPYRSVEDDDYPVVMDNLYSASLETNYKDDETTYRDGPGEEYYLFIERIKTPYKAVGSFAFVIGKLGLVSVDCEYADYSHIKLKGTAPTDYFNSDIKQYFKNTVNWRFGTEVWIKNIALRAGYMQNQSPDKNYDLSRKTYSVGLGYKLSKHCNLDFACIQTNTADYYTPYTGANTIVENLKNRRFSLTFGWAFDYRTF